MNKEWYSRSSENQKNYIDQQIESLTERLKTGRLEIVFFFLDLGNVFENVAFFGDLLLRCPDITHKVKLLFFYSLIFTVHVLSVWHSHSDKVIFNQ